MAATVPRTGSRRRVLAAAAAFLTVVGVAGIGCTSDGEPSPTPTTVDEGATPTAVSHPFEIVDPPKGFELEHEARGTTPATWYAEHLTSQEPYVLLSTDGTVAGDRVAISRFTVLDNRANPRPYVDLDDPNEERYWNRPAYESGDGWSDLTVDQAEGGPLRVSSSTVRSEAELRSVAEQVSPGPPPSDDEVPPSPSLDWSVEGLEEVGRVESIALKALEAPGEVGSSNEPDGSHSQVWSSADLDRTVAVRTLPGVVADLDAIGSHPWLSPDLEQTLTVGGRPARLLHYCFFDLYEEGGQRCSRAVVTTTPWGDLLVVATATAAAEVPAAAGEDDLDPTLIAFAASVEAPA